MAAAIPQIRSAPAPLPGRSYVVLSPKCVWGSPGDVITLAITDNQEKSLLEAGTVKRAEVRPVEAVRKETDHG